MRRQRQVLEEYTKMYCISEVKEIQILVDKDKNMLLNYKVAGKNEQVVVDKGNLKDELEKR